SRALDAAEWQPFNDAQHLVEVERKVLRPQAGALPNRYRLSNLEVGIAKAWLRAPLLGELREVCHDRREPAHEQAERLTIDDQVGVVGNEAAGGAEMDDRLGSLGEFSVVVNMRHHVMAQLLLQVGNPIPIEGVAMRTQFVDLLLRYRKAEPMLGIREADPQVAPRRVARAWREQASHVLARISFDEWVIEAVAAFHAVI